MKGERKWMEGEKHEREDISHIFILETIDNKLAPSFCRFTLRRSLTFPYTVPISATKLFLFVVSAALQGGGGKARPAGNNFSSGEGMGGRPGSPGTSPLVLSSRRIRAHEPVTLSQRVP